MLTSTDSRLWLAVHLLYPNSSQAFDVYQAIAVQSEDQKDKDIRELAFGRLVQVFEKIPAMSSNLSFFEFEGGKVEQWKSLYKSSQKSQLLVFLGVLIFELKISQIAPYVKLSTDKALFLFHQMFKKLVKNNVKVKYNDKLNLKKQNDSRVSYLFTYENLIEYCLNLLSDADADRVKNGLELYPNLQVIQQEYLKIITQIQTLKVQRDQTSFVEISDKSKSKIHVKKDSEWVKEKNSSVAEPINEASFFKSKKIMIATFATFICLSGVFLHLSGVLKNVLLGGEDVIVMEKIQIKPPTDIALESLPKQSDVVETQKLAQISEDASVAAVGDSDTNISAQEPEKIAVVEKNELIENQQPKNSEDKNAAKKPEGGLYRGTVFVKNLDSINSKIIFKVKELGAQKAGEVELGWQKTKSLTYYHFTMPEKNVESLKKYFSQIGKLEIKFEKHPRLIKAGNRRLIIEVKDTK